jgi:CSLREA domain-containing protein
VWLLHGDWLLASRAADISGVNTTADELNSDNDCSLREAIQSANTDTGVDACTAGSGDDCFCQSKRVPLVDRKGDHFGHPA